MTPPAKRAAAKDQNLSDLLKNKNSEVDTPDDDGSLEDAAAQDEAPEDEHKLVSEDPVVVEQYGKKFHFDKTPADLAAETPEESAARYGLNSEVPDDVAKDPNVQVSKDYNLMRPSGGTHLHPDIARDNYNRPLSIGETGVVTRTVSEHVFAGEAELDDKGLSKTKDEVDSSDETDDEE